MGTPAFPNLGKHCSVDDCRQIDFLPFSCDCCHLVFCLQHRSYGAHRCPKANKNDVTVAICPLCAKGVRLIPGEDPNITWESHVNIECDPSNYEKVTKKKKCPVPGCRETLTFSTTMKCRDCNVDHCLKHRFGPDHKCPGPKKAQPGLSFTGFLTRSQTERPSKGAAASSSSSWTTSFFKAAEAGMAKLSTEFNQAFGGSGPSRTGTSQVGSSRGKANVNGKVEQCPQCSMRFSTVGALVDHVEKVHEKKGLIKVTMDVCPKCSKAFRDPVALVEHVEREHRGTSKT